MKKKYEKPQLEGGIMKKKYEKPQLEVLELHYQPALLLPASGGGYTDEVLAPDFDSEIVIFEN